MMRSLRRSFAPWARLTLPALLALLAAGCAATGRKPLTPAELSRVAAERGIPPSGVELPYALDDEMRAWLREQQKAGTIHRGGPAMRQLGSLLNALVHERGLAITYKPGHTGTAAEVFRSRHANCLSFTQLFVAFAREMGVDAYFLAVQDLESYKQLGDLVRYSGHVTAGFGPFNNLKVLEFSIGPPVDYDLVRPVPDLKAVGMFYSNRGAEQLTGGDLAGAIETLEMAVKLAPDLAGAWVNLGVVRRRNGDYAGAEEAYRQALEADPKAASAYENLAALLQYRGETEAAEELLRLSAEAGSRNPYAYLELGDYFLRRGRVEEARRYYRRAMRLYRNRPEAYAALGLAALAADDREEARRWLNKARRRGPEHPRVQTLAHRLEPERQASGSPNS